MIRHICMFKLKEENKVENLQEALVRVQELKELTTIHSYQVVTNVEGTPDTNYDLSLIFDFKSLGDLEDYQKDPRHLEFGAYIRSVRKERACIDYEF